MKMTSAVRWLLAASFVLVLCASASAAQSTSHSHKPVAHSRKSHPSHPMRNNRPKHHAMNTSRTSLLAVRYLQPQQASSVVAANSSASASASKVSRTYFSGILEEEEIEQQGIAPFSPRANAESSHARTYLRDPVIPGTRRILPGRTKREVGLQHSCRNAKIPIRQRPRPQRQTRRDQPAKARPRIGHRPRFRVRSSQRLHRESRAAGLRPKKTALRPLHQRRPRRQNQHPSRRPALAPVPMHRPLHHPPPPTLPPQPRAQQRIHRSANNSISRSTSR